jgi:hypothetical protein
LSSSDLFEAAEYAAAKSSSCPLSGANAKVDLRLKRLNDDELRTRLD